MREGVNHENDHRSRTARREIAVTPLISVLDLDKVQRIREIEASS